MDRLGSWHQNQGKALQVLRVRTSLWLGVYAGHGLSCWPGTLPLLYCGAVLTARIAAAASVSQGGEGGGASPECTEA